MNDLELFIQAYQHLIPENFDWKFYVTYYADLAQAGINSEILAKHHYINYGRKENREYSKKIIETNKIFQIGFNKCGSCSFMDLFGAYSNQKTIHWDNGLLAQKIEYNIWSGEYLPLYGYEEYKVFTDMECFIKQQDNSIKHIQIFKDYFDILDINYPDSVFILNTRNIDNWIKSRLNHISPHNAIINDSSSKNIKYIDLYKQIYNTNSTSDIIDIWTKQWREHHDAVKEYFTRNPNRLIIYDIEKDNISKLRYYFTPRNILFDIKEFPHANRTK